MNAFRTLDHVDVKGKRVLMRVDLNVPVEHGVVTDATRIERAARAITEIADGGGKVILLSHFGRPKGKRDPKDSLKPVAAEVAHVLKRPVSFVDDCVGEGAEQAVAAMKAGDIVCLENTRFHPGEEKNDPAFVAALAKLGDIWVNDAFSAAHRAHASTEGLGHVLPAYAGRTMQAELQALSKALEHPEHPLAAIVGGAKISTKLDLLGNLLKKVDALIIGGAMANTFLKAQGYEVGDSRVEDDLLDTANELVAKAKKQEVKLYLPVDCIVADRFDPKAETKRTTVQEVPRSWMILDIGPASTLLFGEALEDARTIIWNGPMGAFEMDAFSRGTMAMVQKLSTSHALTIVGGGDTDVAVHRAGESSNISYISTGGGAFLMLMEGKVLPGVAALEGKG